MIGRITGTLAEKKAPELLVDVQGVGYELLVSLTTFFSLPNCGENTVLHTHLVVILLIVRHQGCILITFKTILEHLQ